MRQTKKTPTPPTAQERDGLARTYSHTLDGTILSLTGAALKQIALHRRDAVSASRHERRRMAAIVRSDKVQAIVNKAIQRQLDRVERSAPPKKMRICVERQNRRKYKRKHRKVASKSIVPLPAYEAPILDKQGRRGIVMVIDYDGAKRHSFGIAGRRIVYISDPEHCELHPLGWPIFFSNMGADLDEILMGADLLELAQRESRADAKINVNIIIQLPYDVPQDVRAATLKAVAHELFGRHSLPYAASLHRPDPDGDQRNYHGHICGSWRPMTRVAPYSWDIAEDYRADLDGKAYWRHARRRVAEIMTATLERNGTERHYTHLSNAERGLPHKPQKKLDKRKTRAARENEFVADVEANRRTMEANIALEKKLEKQRQQRRERALKRRLAVIARVELARVQPVDLRPVGRGGCARDTMTIAPVPVLQTTTVVSLQAVRTDREPASSVPTITAIAPTALGTIAHLRKVVPVGMESSSRKAIEQVFPGWHDVSKRVRQVTEPGPRTRAEGDVDRIVAVAKPTMQAPRPVGPSATKDAKAKIAPVEPKPLLGSLAAVVRPVEKPGPRVVDLPPVGIPNQTRTTLRPVAATNPSKDYVRIEPVTVRSGRDLSANRINPVSSPILRAPVLTTVRSVGPTAKKTIESVLKPASTPPFVATASARPATAWPRLHPVSAVSSAASPGGPSMTERKAVALPKRQDGAGSTLHPVHAATPPASQPDLRPVAPPGRMTRPKIHSLPPEADTPVIRPIVTKTSDPPTASASLIRPVASAAPEGLDPALAATLRAFGERLTRISASRGQPSDASSAPQETATAMKGETEGGGSLTSPPDGLAREIKAARAFVGRVRNKAIHVGADEDGLILPQPIYWPGNRLTRRGLSDPQVQAELVRMEQRQADYMRHIHPILRETITAELLVKGSPAIIKKLPQEERVRAEAWARTGVWSSLMRMVTDEGEQRSRRDLKRWRKARDKANGSHFASAAKAQAQWTKWPIDLAPGDREALNQDAQRHGANLAAQQAASSQNGIA